MKEKFGIIYYRVHIEFLSLVLGTALFKLKSMLWGIGAGKNIKVWGAVDVVKGPKSSIKIGDNVSLVSCSLRASAAPLYSRVKLRTFTPNAAIIIGNNVGLSGTGITARSRSIQIGNGTIIGPNVIITDSDFHALWPPDNRTCNPALENDKDVFIGKNVWIGMNSVILKGANIGDNSIIGAGSIVTGSIPSNCVAAGNPAKQIKTLPQGDK